MNVETMIAVGVTCLIWFLVILFLTIILVLFNFLKRKINNIDFVVLDIIKNSYSVEFCIGRKVIDPEKGTRYVTAGFLPNSIGMDLGYNIYDSEALPSKNFSRRKVFIIARQDNICTQMNLTKTQYKSLSPAEKELYDKASALNEESKDILRHRLISIDTVEHINATPLLTENTRVALDMQKFAHELHHSKNTNENIRFAMVWAVVIFILTLIACGFIIIYTLNSSPDIIGTVAEKVGGKIATGIAQAISNTSAVPVG